MTKLHISYLGLLSGSMMVTGNMKKIVYSICIKLHLKVGHLIILNDLFTRSLTLICNLGMMDTNIKFAFQSCYMSAHAVCIQDLTALWHGIVICTVHTSDYLLEWIKSRIRKQIRFTPQPIKDDLQSSQCRTLGHFCVLLQRWLQKNVKQRNCNIHRRVQTVSQQDSSLTAALKWIWVTA